MATLQQLEAALVKADAAGNADDARAFAAEIRKLRTAAPVEAPPAESGGVMQQVGNLAAGAVRGAGSIGATLLAPVDAAARAVGIQNDYIGRTDRRQSMDDALQTMGADTNSLAYGAGKIGAEIAGTAGVGGSLANLVGRAPAIARAAPSVIDAVRTAGMTGGNALTRLTGGAITGGASAGLVNPEEAGLGALIGGALPSVVKAAGAVGQSIGRTIRGPEVPQAVGDAVNAAREVGYVIPPTQAKPTLVNRVLEGVSGKITTAQNASARNQTVTNSLAAKALGLADDVKITPEVLGEVKKAAGQAYDELGASGLVTPGEPYIAALDKIAEPFRQAARGFPNAKPSPVLDLVESLKSPQFDAADAVAKIKELRTAADDGFRTGNTDAARASKSAAKALEDALEGHLQAIGQPDVLQRFRDARQLYAKALTVEKAYNPTTGSVDARKLGAQVKKGKPLSGELRTAGEFGNSFPKAAQAVEGMGSLPQTSPLDWVAAGGITAASGNPLAMLAPVIRPIARSATLSPMVQNRLAQGQRPSALADLLGRSPAVQMGYRAAPVLAADQ